MGWDLEPLEPLLLYRAVTLRMNTRINCIMAQMRRAMAARDFHTLITSPEAISAVQGHLTHMKSHLPRTLHQAYALGPTIVLGGGRFPKSEVTLYLCMGLM